MQHEDIPKLVETGAHENDRNWLVRAKGLLQPDWWSVDTRLDDHPCDEALPAERNRLQTALNKTDGLILVEAILEK